jgi:uncharacterized YigZ family protein
MPAPTRTIATNGTWETIVRKSRFICTLERVATEDDARASIERVRKQYWDANHNCTAWNIGPGGRSQRSSDDGEPAGTAGIPMLDVLRRREIIDTVAIVTRYFGGIMLGAGGLVRAYGAAVADAIDRAGVVERRPLSILHVSRPHAQAGQFENALRAMPFRLEAVDYGGTGVTFTLQLEPATIPDFETWVATVTNGEAVPEQAGVVFAEVPVEA